MKKQKQNEIKNIIKKVKNISGQGRTLIMARARSKKLWVAWDIYAHDCIARADDDEV